MKSDLKRTPLHDVHKNAEATMDNVDGWEIKTTPHSHHPSWRE